MLAGCGSTGNGPSCVARVQIGKYKPSKHKLNKYLDKVFFGRLIQFIVYISKLKRITVQKVKSRTCYVKELNNFSAPAV